MENGNAETGPVAPATEGLLLAIGTSLDPSVSARDFLVALRDSLGLEAAAVWVLPPAVAGGAIAFEQLACAPAAAGLPAQLSATHPAVTRFAENPVVFGRGDPEYAAWAPLPEPPGSAFAFWALGDYGMLAMAAADGERLAPVVLRALSPVLERFSIALYGLRAASRLERETAEHLATTASLERERSLSRSLIDSIPDLIFYQDLDGAYLGCNKAFERLVGKPEEALVGQNDTALLGRLGVGTDELVEAARAGVPRERRSQQWVRFADGRRVLLETLLTPYYGPSGQLLGLIGISRDETEQHEAVAARHESEERYRAIIEQAVDAVVLYRVDDGCFVEFNEPAHRGLGYSRAAFAQLSVCDVMLDESTEAMRPARCGEANVYEARCRALNGEMRDMLVAAKRIELRDGEYIAAVWHDITDRRRDEERLRQAAKVFESTAEGVMVTDADNRIVAVNKTFSEITGYAEQEVLGRNPALLSSGRQDRTFYSALWRELRTTGKWRGEIWNRRKNGEVFPQWETISEVRDEKGRLTHHVAVFSDMTLVKQSLEQLDHLAHHDPLTDLPNRLLFLTRLDYAIERAKRDATHLAVLFLDLDRFKNINDSLGHPVGDQVLQAVSERLRARVGSEDTLARLGGDEFTVLLEGLAKPQDAAEVVLELIECLREPVRLPGDHELYIDVGIGISMYPEDGSDGTELVRNADAAMYRAKALGPGSYCFYTEDMTREIAQRLALETRLRQAFERGDLRINYQPILALDTRQPVAVEALVHWTDPVLGSVSPEQFIPLAEETGLIEQIGDWVLREACAQLVRWDEAGVPRLTMAVNLSARQLERAGFADRVRDVLRRTGLTADRLELELTETSLMSQQALGKATLTELKHMGIRLAVDDFGTGYSSLAYLKQLDVDKLKIDKSFVSDIPHDTSDLQIVSAIVVMARNLRLRLVAEGVETVEQEEILKGLGCDFVQGYLYAQPLAPARLERFARRYQHNYEQLAAGDSSETSAKRA